MFGTFKNFKKWSLAVSLIGITVLSVRSQTVPQNGLSLWLKQDLQYKFRQGDPAKVSEGGPADYQGTVFDVNVWHKLPVTGSSMDLSQCEIPNNSSDDATSNGFGSAFESLSSGYHLGELGPGDYALFCRVYDSSGMNVFESNLVKFRIIAQNPANGGRSNRQPVKEYGIDHSRNLVTYPQVPAAIAEYINSLQLPSSVGEYSTFAPAGNAQASVNSWFTAAVKGESSWGGTFATEGTTSQYKTAYGWLQDWDNFSRARETADTSQNQTSIIYSDLGYNELYSFNGNNDYYIRIGEMRTDVDNGLGVTQQTHKGSVHTNSNNDTTINGNNDDPFRHINRWKNNVVAGWEEFTDKDLATAISEVNALGSTGDVFREMLYDGINKYNHGENNKLLKLNPAGRIVVGRIPDYVNETIIRYGLIINVIPVNIRDITKVEQEIMLKGDVYGSFVLSLNGASVTVPAPIIASKAKDAPAAAAANLLAMQTALETLVGSGNVTVNYSLEPNPDSSDKSPTHPTWNCIFKNQEHLLTSALQTLSLHYPVP